MIVSLEVKWIKPDIPECSIGFLLQSSSWLSFSVTMLSSERQRQAPALLVKHQPTINRKHKPLLIVRCSWKRRELIYTLIPKRYAWWIHNNSIKWFILLWVADAERGLGVLYLCGEFGGVEHWSQILPKLRECMFLCNVTFSKSLRKIWCSSFEDKQQSALNTYSGDLNAK